MCIRKLFYLSWVRCPHRNNSQSTENFPDWLVKKMVNLFLHTTNIPICFQIILIELNSNNPKFDLFVYHLYFSSLNTDALKKSKNEWIILKTVLAWLPSVWPDCANIITSFQKSRHIFLNERLPMN